MKAIASLTISTMLLLSSCSKDKFGANDFTARNLSVEVSDEPIPSSGDATPDSDEAKAAAAAEIEREDIIEVASGQAVDPSTSPAAPGSDEPGAAPAADDSTGPGKSVDKGNGKGGSKEKVNGKSKRSSEDLANAGACGGSLKSNRVKVSGSLNKVTVDSKTAYALKVTGNQNEVTMDVKGATPGIGMPGVCMFIAGNKNKIIIDVGVQLGAIYVKARGNQALIEVRVAKDASVADLHLDFNGNSPKMVLSGEGSYPCEAAALKGKTADVSCQK